MHRALIFAILLLTWHRALAMADSTGTGNQSPKSASKDRSIVMCVAYSPDREQQAIASGSWDGNLEIWEVNKFQEPKYRVRGHEGGVLSIAFHPSGKLLVSSGWDHQIKIWDLKSAPPKPYTLPQKHRAAVLCVAINPDGSKLACGSWDNTISLWDMRTGQPAFVRTLAGHEGPVQALAFSSSKHLASGGQDGAIKIWDVAKVWDADNREEIKEIKTLSNEAPVRSIVFRPDARVLASNGPDDKILLWATDNWEKKPATLRRYFAPVTALAFCRGGKELISAYKDGTIKLWDGSLGATDGGPVGGGPYSEMGILASQEATVITPVPTVRSLSVSRDGETFVWGGNNPRIGLKSIKTGILNEPLKGHSLGVLAVAASPRGEFLASGSWDNEVKLWDAGNDENLAEANKPSATGTGKPDTTSAGQGQANTATKDQTDTQQHKGAVTAVAFSPDGKLLVSGSYDKTLRFWQLSKASYQGLKNPIVIQAQSQVNGLAFSPDGKTLATCGDDKLIKLWDVATCKVKATLDGHTNYVTSVAFSGDGRYLASGSWDNTVKIWDVDSKTPTVVKNQCRHSREVTSVAFSPDSKWVASGSYDKTVALWNFKTDDVHLFRDHQDTVRGVAFSPDGTFLASGSDDKQVLVWNIRNVNSYEKPISLGHDGPVYCVTFVWPNVVASGSADKTIKSWLVLPNP